MNRTLRALAAALAALLSAAPAAFAQGAPAAAGDVLERGFADPPQSALPRTWWHWTRGNVSLPGITRDLEWMKRVGIGGFQLADVNFGGGQTVEEPVVFGTPAWLAAVRHAAAEADRLGLEMAIFSSPGWSLTGGPWVKPEEAMKKLVWSDTVVRGPGRFAGKLPAPPSVNGPFQELGRRSSDPTYYGDQAVLAYRTPPDEPGTAPPRPTVTTQAGPVDATALLDGDLNTALVVRAPAGGGPAWVQLAYAEPFTARAVTLAGRGGIPFGRVLASGDGRVFRTLATLPGPQGYRGGTVRTFAFPETTARFYRVELTGGPPSPAAVIAEPAPKPDTAYVLTRIALHSGARVHRWEDKAGFNFMFDYDSSDTPPVPAADAVDREGIVELTTRMRPDGTLDWQVPPGRWTILRLGYSLTGAKNRPAVPAALGYEVDKLSRKHVEAYLHGYFDSIAAALGPLFGRSLRAVMVDSWEAGIQNWTEEMPAEFRRLRGYDPTPYLPVLTGRVVESAEVSDRFLWDFRRTLVDLFAENHYATITDFAHRRGMVTYGEASGVSLEPMEDALLNKKNVDIPMGEFWVHDLHPSSMYYQDVRGAASAAHAYGKPVVAAESFTGGGYESPYTLKKIADHWFAQGVNRLVFHTSAHQPLDTKPGNVMVGTHLHRNITWAEEARPFMRYVARTSFLLQQGLPVADLAYLLDEGAPSTMPFWGAGLRPAPPEGYDYDYLNADVLLHRLSVAPDGRLLLPDGTAYRVLMLPETNRMTLPVLRKLRELVEGGATVAGPRPERSPSLEGWPEADRELRAIAGEMWGDLDGVSRTRRPFGRGRVVWGEPPAAVLATLGVPPDLEHGRPLGGDLDWIHRRAGDTDLYYVASGYDRPVRLEARFRVAGREAELWHPDTGEMEPAAYRIEGDLTTVPLSLEEREAVFVVFRRPAAAPSRDLPREDTTTLATLQGPWALTFPPGLGAPDSIRLAELGSWTESGDPGVRYFSGTATYRTTFRLPRGGKRPGARVLLDLGGVGDLATVTLNGKPLGTAWKAPFRVDATAALVPGVNRLEIAVTDEWTNRLLGDRSLPEGAKVLPSAPPAFFGPPPPLPPSGLLGPVKLLAVAAAPDER
jgi:hypothetical protein